MISLKKSASTNRASPATSTSCIRQASYKSIPTAPSAYTRSGRALPRAGDVAEIIQAEHARELQQTRRPPRTYEEGGEMMQKEKIQHKDDLTIALPSEKEVLITRTLHAPRKLVFQAMTEPRHLREWLGPRVMTMTVADADLRVGGAWRFVHRAPDGTDHAFSGVIQEFRAPERVVRTNNYENIPGAESLETMTLEQHGE